MTEREVVSEREVLAKSEVSLLINSYNDIFSSFDPRPYSQRSLSVDFLDEAERATKEIRPGIFELRFLIPKAQRSLDKEAVIKKRLREHFKRHLDMLEAEKRRETRRGMLLASIGFLFMIFAAAIKTFTSSKFGYSVLVILFDPAGWFMLWTGLDTIFFKSKEKRVDLEFYRKMNKSEIIFNHY